MSNTGETLINAIVSNPFLMAINNCPGVPAQMSRAVYGKTQDDSGAGTAIENNRDMQKISILRWGSLGRTRKPPFGIS